MRKIGLHLGVHKTGSSYLQNTFEANAASLRDANVGYAPLKELRRNFTERLIWSRKHEMDEAHPLEYVDTLLQPPIVLISDENILGRLYNFEDGLPYPQAGSNLARAVELVGGDHHSVTVFLCIRNYADWLESVYLQALRAKLIVPFAVFCKRVDFDSISWIKLVSDLTKAAPECCFVIWPYEYFLKNNDSIIERISKFTGTGLPLRPERPANLSYSAVAHSILLGAKRSRAALQPEHLEKLHRFVRSTFSVAHGYERPKLLSQQKREELTARYRLDQQKLAEVAGARVELMGFESNEV